MERIETNLPGVVVIRPDLHEDRRGFFCETFSARDFESLGISSQFVQDNYVFSVKNVLRGLHYQMIQPQAKLVYAASGEIFDVAVDIRRGSPTFGRWTGVRLSSETPEMIYIPEGFAHGYYVMSESAGVVYKCSDYYASEGGRGVAWNDSDIGIQWPTEDAFPILSESDAKWGHLRDVPIDDLPAHRAEDA